MIGAVSGADSVLIGVTVLSVGLAALLGVGALVHVQNARRQHMMVARHVSKWSGWLHDADLLLAIESLVDAFSAEVYGPRGDRGDRPPPRDEWTLQGADLWTRLHSYLEEMERLESDALHLPFDGIGEWEGSVIQDLLARLQRARTLELRLARIAQSRRLDFGPGSLDF